MRANWTSWAGTCLWHGVVVAQDRPETMKLNTFKDTAVIVGGNDHCGEQTWGISYHEYIKEFTLGDLRHTTCAAMSAGRFICWWLIRFACFDTGSCLGLGCISDVGAPLLCWTFAVWPCRIISVLALCLRIPWYESAGDITRCFRGYYPPISVEPPPPLLLKPLRGSAVVPEKYERLQQRPIFLLGL